MQITKSIRRIVIASAMLAASLASQLPSALAQDAHPAGATPQAQSTAEQVDSRVYYVDFRARTAASYGHSFVWFGRMDRKAVDIAGLHPASDSPIPYILGHVIPVPSETGRSYGDLDEEYLTASYRVVMTEAEAKPVFAYIKHLQASSPTWGPLYNCIHFVNDIARFMGLRDPGTGYIYPEKWVNDLRRLNGGRNNQLVRLSDIRARYARQGAATTFAQAPVSKPRQTAATRQAQTAPRQVQTQSHARTAAAGQGSSIPDPARTW
jgi:hypothetical protein